MNILNIDLSGWQGSMIITTLKLLFICICGCAAILVSVVATYGNI